MKYSLLVKKEFDKPSEFLSLAIISRFKFSPRLICQLDVTVTSTYKLVVLTSNIRVTQLSESEM